MICENCGKSLNENIDVIVSIKENDVVNIFCKQCATAFGHCPMCQHNTECGFFHDLDPMPQFRTVSRTMRQGNATFVEQRQVPNAERIKKFCIDGKCKCFLDDPEHPLCCRFGGCATCTNYCELEKYKFIQDFSMEVANEN